MTWLDRILPKRNTPFDSRKKSVPEGVWSKCGQCQAVLYKAELERCQDVCPKCGFHMRLSARTRLERFLDKDSQLELFANLKPIDILKFKDSKKYRDRLNAAQKMTKENDALIVISGEVLEIPVVAAAFEFRFMGGSMASVVGEKFVRAVNYCIEQQRPLICFSASGGARMQEALTSLLQMSKTSAALHKLSQEKLPFISVLTDPTMGGVSASLAMLGDVNVAEPGALIGFAGSRVIEQTVRETLPEGFQRSEFLLEKGAIDMIIDRREMRQKLASILSKLLHLSEPLEEKQIEKTESETPEEKDI